MVLILLLLVAAVFGLTGLIANPDYEIPAGYAALAVVGYGLMWAYIGLRIGQHIRPVR
jgi:hypothetical protein